METLLMSTQLTKEQQMIVNYAPQQNTIISADAGSGKTATIVFTVENLLKKNPHAKILIVVFNVHIKDELRLRLKSPNVFIFTMHTLGNALLKTSTSGKYVNNAYLRVNPNRKYTKILRDLIGFGKGTKAAIDTAFELLNIARMTNSKFEPSVLYTLAQRYDIAISGPEVNVLPEALEIGKQQFLEKKWADFGDMLYLPESLDLNFPKSGLWLGSGEEKQFVGEPFDYIFADEAQDFGESMQRLVRRFMHNNTKVCFVGDSLQAINGYTGSDPYSLDNLSIKYSCAELPLTTVFRNPANHIEKINGIFPKNSKAFKNFDGLWEDVDNINLVDIPNDSVILGRFRNGKQAKLWDYFFNLLEIGRECTLFGINPLQIVEKIVPDELQKDFSNIVPNLQSYVIETLQDYKAKGWHNVAEDFEKDAQLTQRLIENCACNSWDNFEKWVKGMTYDRKGRINLSTIHTFKGYEKPNVYLIDSGSFPYKGKTPLAELQEQAVHYVALTRSSQNMFNVVSKQ